MPISLLLRDTRYHDLIVQRHDVPGDTQLTSSFEGGGTCFNTPVELMTWPNETSARGGQSGSRIDSSSSDGCGGRSGCFSHGGSGAGGPVISHETLVSGGRGDCLLHCGQLLHGGAAVTSGTRFIVVGFVAERWDGNSS